MLHSWAEKLSREFKRASRNSEEFQEFPCSGILEVQGGATIKGREIGKLKISNKPDATQEWIAASGAFN